MQEKIRWLWLVAFVAVTCKGEMVEKKDEKDSSSIPVESRNGRGSIYPLDSLQE